MLNNIFKRNIQEVHDFTVCTQASIMESFSETELYDFMMLENMRMSQVVIENARYVYMGERDECTEIVQESTNDFLDGVVEFFKKLLAKVKEWFGKIFLLIQTLLGNTGKMLNGNKDAFLKKDASFDMIGYEYSIKTDSPNMEPITKLVSEYNKDITDIKNIKAQDIDTLRDEFKGSIHKLRGEILTSKQSISEGELRQETNAFFRKGETDSSNITINKSYIGKIAEEYNQIKKNYEESVKQKRDVEVQLESLKKFFENGAKQVKYDNNGDKVIATNQIELKDTYVKRSDNGTNHLASTGTLKTLNKYFNYRYEQSKEMSNIVITVLQCKVNALREQLKFYDACVRKWIIVPNNSINGVVETEKGSKGGDK